MKDHLGMSKQQHKHNQFSVEGPFLQCRRALSFRFQQLCFINQLGLPIVSISQYLCHLIFCHVCFPYSSNFIGQYYMGNSIHYVFINIIPMTLLFSWKSADTHTPNKKKPKKPPKKSGHLVCLKSFWFSPIQKEKKSFGVSYRMGLI